MLAKPLPSASFRASVFARGGDAKNASRLARARAPGPARRTDPCPIVASTSSIESVSSHRGQPSSRPIAIVADDRRLRRRRRPQRASTVRPRAAAAAAPAVAGSLLGFGPLIAATDQWGVWAAVLCAGASSSITLVPVRPRRRGERRSLRTLSNPGASLRPALVHVITYLTNHITSRHVVRQSNDDTSGSFGLWGGKKRWGAAIGGPPLLATLAALLASNLGVIPTSAPPYVVVTKFLLPLAVPLLLLTADMRCVGFITLVPIRPRRRGERRFLRTFSPVASLRPGSLAFKNTRPRCLSTPLLTPLNSTPISSLVWTLDPETRVRGDGTRFIRILYRIPWDDYRKRARVRDRAHGGAGRRRVEDGRGVDGAAHRRRGELRRRRGGVGHRAGSGRRGIRRVRSLLHSHWSPHDRVGVVHADP